MTQRPFAIALLLVLSASAWRLVSSTRETPPARPNPPAQAPAKRAPQGAANRAARVQPPPVTYPTHPSRRISTGAAQSDFPAATATAAGTVWAAWVEWDGKQDRIALRNLAWDAGRPSILFDDGSDTHAAPTLAPSGGRIYCAWSARAGDDWELFGAWVGADGRAGSPERLTRAAGSDLDPKLVSDSRGKLTLAWQAFRGGKSDVYVRQIESSGWGKDLRVSPAAANDWEPQVAADSTGTVWIVWDSYATGDYNVYARALAGGALGVLVPIATSTEAEFHAAAACDSTGRLWVAYDLGGENWGKDFSPGSRTSAPGSGGLHRSRRLGIRVLGRQGLLEPAADVATVFQERMKNFAELPTLGIDGTGALWLIFRHFTAPAPTEIYHFYATRWTGSAWTDPVQLAESAGRNAQRAAVVRGDDGRLQVFFAGDGRDTQPMPPDSVRSRTTAIFATRLPAGAEAKQEAVHTVRLQPERRSAPAHARYSTTIGGRRYELLYGDLHRHTDIRGHSGVDGSVLDTYRYALDAAELDFVGATDHNQVTGGRWADGLRDYEWWWVQKVAEMYSNPPAFNGMYAYEHSLATPSGHRNIVFLRRSAPMRLADRERGSSDNLPPNLWEWIQGILRADPSQKAVIIPHTFAEATQPRADWNWENPEFEPLLEIYQGDRSSYETLDAAAGEKRGRSQLTERGRFATDALDKGYRYGFIASSDHASTHNSYACVWVREATRAGIIEAMLARRAFASSDDIILDATLDGRAMGEAFDLETDPVLRIYARGRSDLVRIDVVRDGKVVYTAKGKGREYRGMYREPRPSAGRHYYYVRVIQRDVEAPEGDPEMAWGSPFFVNIQ